MNAEKWNDYWRSKQASEFLEALSHKAGIPALSLVQIKKGKGGGSWIHPQVVNLNVLGRRRRSVNEKRRMREGNARGGANRGTKPPTPAPEALANRSERETRTPQTRDAVAALRAEYEENTCRVDFTPTEIVELGKKIEEMERPKAKSRQGSRTDKPSGKLPEGSRGDTRDKVANALGV